MKKITSEDKRQKRKILKENCCPIRSQLATQKKKKLGRLSLHENWMRTFVLRIFMCFSRHIALVCRALKLSIHACKMKLIDHCIHNKRLDCKYMSQRVSPMY